ncbi:DUF5134 domain-containing protein [Saccharopolyspora halophila]|uniref:DUF5134 domain-containing protein n=1 Tax=Saccharopolyspora halophila TaxID=405551 RepID=UPI0031E1A875
MSALGQVAAGVVVVATAIALLRLGTRLRTRTRPGHVEVAHASMGVGMTAMHLPGVVPPIAWAVLFTALAVWLGVLAVRKRVPSYLHHVIGSLAMAYMVVAQRTRGSSTSLLVPSGHHHAHGPAVSVATHAPGYSVPLLAWIFAVYCLLSAGFAGTDAVRGRDRRARISGAVELALSAAMAHMFLSTL